MTENKSSAKTQNKGTGKSSAKKGTSSPRGAAAAKRRQEELARQKRNQLIREIVFVVIFGLCVLLFVSNFAESLSAVNNVSRKIFGTLSYVWPFVILVFSWLFLFTEINAQLLIRFFSTLLFMFALSGIFSLVLDTPEGGLLGRANTAMFTGWLGKAGTIIVDCVFLIIAMILFTGFSVTGAVRDYRERTKEDRLLRSRESELRGEQRSLLREEASSRRRAKEREKIDRLEQENDELRSRRERSDDQDEMIRSRFQPVYGIGDTTISDSGAPFDTSFGEQEDALKKNTKLFNSYKNSGTEKPPVKENGNPGDDFIPSINIPSEYFGPEGDSSETAELPNTGGKTRSAQTDNKRPKDAFKAESVKTGAAEDTEVPFDLDKEDEYVRTVITGSGKRITHDVDRVNFDGLEIIRGGSGEAAGTDSTYSEGTAGYEEEPAEGGAIGGSASSVKSATQAVKAANTPTAADQQEIEREIREEPKKEYRFPPMRLLKHGAASGQSKAELEKELRDTAAKLQETLRIFGVGCTITNITCGPSVTRYEIQPDVGVKVSRIVSLTDDIKLNLAAADIRMEAPIPGKSAIGIEIPNKVKKGVALRDLLESDEFREASSNLSFAAGRDIEGNTIIANIEKMPHLLVAGATGSGKSVCINTMIMSILYHSKPTDVKLILIDPKVVELSVYNGIPHLLLPVVTDPKKAAAALNWAVAEMEQRYQQFAEYGVRGIEGFNQMIDRDEPTGSDGYPVKRMPKILIIVDELADLMMVASNDVETAICRLAQKARAAGIHLVLATQRPSVDVITGLIKANIPSRIAFAVSSGTDSRTILDGVGAEKLLGMGDMLYAPAGSSKALRVQGAFVSDDEIRNVVEFLAKEGEVKGSGTAENVDLSTPSGTVGGAAGSADDRDEYFAAAGRLIVEKEKCSIGMLQRQFKIGFNRAARIVDQLCDAGVVGEEEGTKPRKVLMNIAEFEEFLKG